MEAATSQSPTSRLEGVRAFLCRTDSIRDPKLLARYTDLLDEEERARLARYRFEEDAREFLISHALLRVSLSQWRQIAPDAWRFRRNEHGRPEIAGKQFPPVRFSLSHTRGLVACIIGEGAEVGIDVENRIRNGNFLAIAERFFAAEEKAALRVLADDRQQDRFLALWTLKEAYSKARGLGLPVAFDEVGFNIDGDRITASFRDKSADDALLWSFRLMQPTQEHLLAVAWRTTATPSPRLTASWLVPLTNQAGILPERPGAASEL
jgi:4'-phosphopantetheinyl transferase